jgi:hypothetical protein
VAGLEAPGGLAVVEVVLLFLLTTAVFVAVAVYDTKAAFFVFVLLYGVYPRFFALGLSDVGLALTMQRTALFMLLGMYLLHALWGSPEVKEAWKLLVRQKTLLIALSVYLLARLVGNIAAGRVDVTVFGQLISESLISIFVLALTVTYVKTRRDINAFLMVLMLSLLFNQLIASYEFITQQPIFPADLGLLYDAGSRGEAVLEGRVRDSAFRAMGVFDNPLKLAVFLGMLLPFAVFLLVWARKDLMRLLAAVVVILAVPVVWFSGSRAGMGAVALVFGWQLYAWLGAGMSALTKKLFLMCGFGLSAVLVYAFAGQLMQEILFGDAYARSTEARFDAYLTVPLLLMESPWFGFGYARNIVEQLDLGALDPFYLRLALEGGAVSLAAFIVFIVRVLQISVSTCNSALSESDIALSRAIGISIVVAALLALILTLSYVRMYVFLFAGLAVALAAMPPESSSAARHQDPAR